MTNISLFEVSGLSFLDSLISELDKTTLRKVILDLKRLKEDLRETKIFISVEKIDIVILSFIIKINIIMIYLL